jgi:hypothetical protein
MRSIHPFYQGDHMFNALLALIVVIVDILVDAAKKLVGLAFFAALLSLGSIVALILILDHLVG